MALTPPGSPAAVQRLRSVDLSGPAGRLEAVVNEGATGAQFAALVCHPHPNGGGTLHNKVVYHAMKVLNAPEWGLGWPVLRFNFRGTGLSKGTHDGRAETGDVLAALAWLENAYNLPLVVAGFSFGAAMALSACCARPDVRQLQRWDCPRAPRAANTGIAFWQSVLFPNYFSAAIKTSLLPARNWRMWPQPHLNQNNWCLSPAPIIFLPVNWSQCSKRWPVG